VVRRLHNGGIKRYYYAGSLGMEDPRHVNTLIRLTLERFPDVEVGFHVHNLAGNGMANIVAALDAGASSIEGSICDVIAAAWDVAKLLDITPRSHVTASGTRAQVMRDAQIHARSHPE
jgi:hydroxymethylglutaryl-CoA lyase